VKRLLAAVCAAVSVLCAPALADTIICHAVNDVYIDQGSPDDNQGHRTRVLVSWHNSYLAARGLWQFDIPVDLDAADISSAVMVVSRNSTTGTGSGIDVYVYALNAGFDEDYDTWNTLDGGHFDDSVVSGGYFPPWPCSPPCIASIDLTTLLQGNLDKVREHGILMMVQNEGTGSNRFQNFATKEEVPPSTGAYLEIVVGGGQSSAPGIRMTDALRIHPNPFNPRTAVTFTLPVSQPVHLGIYDLSGRLVRTLLHGTAEAGPHAVEWDGRGHCGRPAASGVYMVRLTMADGVQQTGKAALSR